MKTNKNQAGLLALMSATLLMSVGMAQAESMFWNCDLNDSSCRSAIVQESQKVGNNVTADMGRVATMIQPRECFERQRVRTNNQFILVHEQKCAITTPGQAKLLHRKYSQLLSDANKYSGLNTTMSMAQKVARTIWCTSCADGTEAERSASEMQSAASRFSVRLKAIELIMLQNGWADIGDRSVSYRFVRDQDYKLEHEAF